MRDRRTFGSAAMIATVLVLAVGWAGAWAADVSTGDGLVLRLDDATGRVQAVAVDGRSLPLLEGAPGGFSYRELRPVKKHDPKVLAETDFEGNEGGWAPVANANWQKGEEVAAARRTDGGADGSQCYVRLGDKQRYGHGVGFRERVPVQPGTLYEISWSARVPSKSATYILYLRLFDSAGRDVTEKTSPPGKWRYSPYTTTHYQYPIATKGADAWEKLIRTYLVPEGVAYLQIALCLWRGDYVDADSLQVVSVGRGGWQKTKIPGGPLSAAPDGKGYCQQVSLPKEGLAFTLKYVPKSGCIWVEGEVRETHEPMQDRALEVSYTLPIRPKGWGWHDDIRSCKRIEGPDVCRNVFSCGGHAVSLYPFSCITDGETGVALAVPMDCPRIERRECGAVGGFRTVLDLGLSPLTKKIGPGKATFAFVIYRTDAQWGFRSAAARYYEIFPHFFEKRAEREGCWLFPVHPNEIPNPEDFGLTFWEGFSRKAEVRDCARKHGIYIFPYTEAWGLRQPLPGVEEREDAPPHDEVLATLKKWAGDRTSKEKWAGGPRWETAQAILNSLPMQADGTAPFMLDKYSAWMHWWKTNPDPDVPLPNRWSICKTHKIDPVLPDADGIYLDSVSLWGSVYENYRKEHIACTDFPLSFGPETGRPCIPAAVSQHEFIAWLAGELHPQGKLLHMNIFSGAYRFHAHLGDVLGSEVGRLCGRGTRPLTEVETDAVSNMRRTYAYRKPTTNLLQEGNFHKPVPALTHEQIEEYVDHQTFYGFYPGIATAGGEEKPGYRNWKRYFRSPEQFERDRDLFKKYIPVIRRINKAGWEPVTHATTSEEDVFIERFGSWKKGNLHFTLRNQAGEEKRCTVSIQRVALGAKAENLGRVFVEDLLSEFRAQVRAAGSAGTVTLQMELRPARTAVISVSGERK